MSFRELAMWIFARRTLPQSTLRNYAEERRETTLFSACLCETSVASAVIIPPSTTSHLDNWCRSFMFRIVERSLRNRGGDSMPDSFDSDFNFDSGFRACEVTRDGRQCDHVLQNGVSSQQAH